ncbi:MAG: hypothetical protein R3C00_00950 [Hyphomonas sp.]
MKKPGRARAAPGLSYPVGGRLFRRFPREVSAPSSEDLRRPRRRLHHAVNRIGCVGSLGRLVLVAAGIRLAAPPAAAGIVPCRPCRPRQGFRIGLVGIDHAHRIIATPDELSSASRRSTRASISTSSAGVGHIIVAIIARSVAIVAAALVAVVAAAALLLLLAVTRFLLLGNDALVMFGKLKIGFRQDTVAAGLGIPGVLQVFFGPAAPIHADFTSGPTDSKCRLGLLKLFWLLPPDRRLRPRERFMISPMFMRLHCFWQAVPIALAVSIQLASPVARVSDRKSGSSRAAFIGT